MISPEHLHDLHRLVRDAAANLGYAVANLGPHDDFFWHAVSHHDTEHAHAHAVFRGNLADRDIDRAVQRALEQRLERGREYYRQQRELEHQRERDRGQGLER